jgi:hypothetical protein
MMVDYSIKMTLSATSFASIEFRADSKVTSGFANSEEDLNNKITSLLKTLGIDY